MKCIYIRIFILLSLFQETSRRFNKNVEAFEVKRRSVFKKHQGLLTSEWGYAFIGNLCNKMKNVDYLCKIVRNQDEETNNLLNQHKSKIMKTRNDFNKYGLITMIGWNILLIVLILIVSTIKGFPFTYIFDDGTGGIGMTIFLLLWSLIWYGIGYKSRKDYVIARNMYREQVPLLEYEQFNKAYRDYYIGKQAKLLSIVFATAVPWYIIGYVDFPMTTKDVIIVAILAVISASCFYLSKKALNFNS